MRTRMALLAWALYLAGLDHLLAAPSSQMPDGSQFQFWEAPLQFSKTYYVDGAAALSDDNGPGSKERPFRTINKAGQVLQPGERAVIAGGVYREAIHPARGGTGPDKMISYEPAPGAKVIVKGSNRAERWLGAEPRMVRQAFSVRFRQDLAGETGWFAFGVQRCQAGTTLCGNRRREG